MTESPEAVGGPGRFRVNPDAVAQRVGEEMVVVHLTTDRMLVLNATAARAWELLTAGHDIRTVHSRMMQEFVVKPDQLTDELDRLVRQLEAEKLI